MAVTIKAVVPPTKIYKFGKVADGNASMKEVLGGKGANLAEMSALGVPVPSGFTIPCSASMAYKSYRGKASHLAAFLSSLWAAVKVGTEYLEDSAEYMPLVSVRSGARDSMPGMMDTILNVGITSGTIGLWAKRLGERAAYDSYRRLIQMYSSVALGVPLERFEAILSATRNEVGAKTDADLTADHLRRIVSRYLKMLSEVAVVFPDSFDEQLRGAILAVFKSWDNPRAVEYRKINGIPDDWGTAVNVQSMVFGNMGDDSATGVLFSRDPSTGQAVITGEFLVNAQGEDVVAGIRTPLDLYEMDKWNPEAFEELVSTVGKLEKHYRDMQDIEFTVQQGTLYILQTRNGKRSDLAAFKIAHDMAEEGLIKKSEAVSRVTQSQLMGVMSDKIDPKFKTAPHFSGIAAGGGLVTGEAVFSSENAVNCKGPCILIRQETDPDDLAGINAAKGILTSTGGLTSHAAVVARGMGKTCVVGATDLVVSENFAQSGAWVIHAGDKVTIDGSTGNVWLGLAVPVLAGGATDEVKKIIGWAMEGSAGISERVEVTCKMDAAQIKSAVESAVCDSIYLDTALLEAPSPVADPALDSVRNGIEWLGEAVSSAKAKEVVVDLATLEDQMGPADLVFDSMFGIGKDHEDSVVLTKVFAMSKWSPAARSKIVVKLPSKPLPDASKMLKDEGFKVMGYVATVADVLNAGGPIQVTDEVIKAVFGTPEAYKAVCKMVEDATGKKLSASLGTPVYWYDFLSKGGA